MADLSEAEALTTPEFWDRRYTKSDGSNPTHEWFRTFKALEPFFEKHLFSKRHPNTSPRIMHLGSGDSTIPADLSARGYKNQLCLDFSTVVVDLMRQRHADVAGIEWQWADIRDMPEAAPTASVDVAFDKSTLDAMIHGSPWSPPDDVRENTAKYLSEVHRALKDDGVFLYITYRQPHFMRPLLNADNLWVMDMHVLSDGESAFDYYGFVLRKRRKNDAHADS
ncbi:S-adenosyl-L-methionine-dependent methyltransferase [Colletotrichum phormii]|uniref:S-adenosyl-L-methionine-dependent methyltransferase n=1 Tax=Colletotrichum phormii TaxID=359342 RepID=A0AAI9ZID4_9PEZI|nr:S-adenosyl-L-methionine-dependent methyltransferase [Colletotrichum phormii]KAK1625046.1 S-adenosyl-L-methionine-dependent methyltransferase [Colletotrichum phormii]